MRLAILAVLLMAGVAGADYDSACVGDECIYYERGESQDYGEFIVLDTAVTATDFQIWTPPGCPPGYGKVEIEVPENLFGYPQITIECGRVK